MNFDILSDRELRTGINDYEYSTMELDSLEDSKMPTTVAR